MNSKNDNTKDTAKISEEEENQEKKTNFLPIVGILGVVVLAGLGFLFLGTPANTGLIALAPESAYTAPVNTEPQCTTEYYTEQVPVESQVPVTETNCVAAEPAQTTQKNPWAYYNSFPSDKQSAIIESETTVALEGKCTDTTHFETVVKMQETSKSRIIC